MNAMLGLALLSGLGGVSDRVHESWITRAACRAVLPGGEWRRAVRDEAARQGRQDDFDLVRVVDAKYLTVLGEVEEALDGSFFSFIMGGRPVSQAGRLWLASGGRVGERPTLEQLNDLGQVVQAALAGIPNDMRSPSLAAKARKTSRKQ